jgi:hypothetical protein
MRRLAALVALLVGLIVLTPWVYASTAETWTDGIYDAESDELAQATRPADGVVERLPWLAVGPVLAVVRADAPPDDARVPSCSFHAAANRAPPLSLTVLRSV